jgi:amino acid adenylation domain-containing protein/non-ribosomal peptide synthase protein (TIGR01720 family)
VSVSERPASGIDLSRQQKRELLERLVRQRLQQGERGPLSFAQRRLWFLDQLDPGSGAYNAASALRLKGPLQVAALAASLSEIVRRQKVLRTIFKNTGNEPVQEVAPARPVALPVVDFAALPSSRRLRETRRAVSRLNAAPFDLARGPLLRLTLLRLAPGEAVLAMQTHHIAADGWSMGILVRELSALYEACRAGRSSPLPELRLHYLDYARWQRRRLRGEALEPQLRYWRGQLAGMVPLELLTDRPRPPLQSFRGASQSFSLARVDRRALGDLGRASRATPFIVLLAGFQVLLARYSGQQEVSVGSPVTNRNRRELEELIGCFVNTVVLRTDLSGDPTFAEAVSRVRETVLGAFAHQELPFEAVVEALQPVRDLSRPPLVQVMLTLHHLPVLESRLAELRAFTFGSDLEVAKVDLSLEVWDGQGQLSGALEYCRDLFDRGTIVRLLAHFERLLAAAIAAPGTRIGELALLGEGERQQLLAEWNDSGRSWPGETCLEELLAAQTARTPGAVALRCRGESWTYATLERRVAQAAAGLRAATAGAGSLVAVALPRDGELLVAMLALWRVGAAYLPLDPFHPEARNRQVIARSGASLVLTTPELRPRVAAALAGVPDAPRLLDLAELAGLARGRDREAAPAAPAPGGAGRLAYVIYTSGSSGAPKGAMLEHRGMVNHLLAKVEALALDDRDAVAQNASQCFDISVWQFISPLLVGGRSVVIGDEEMRDVERQVAELAREKVTVVETVPSLLSVLLETPLADDAGLAGLRWLLSNGEPLTPALAARWVQRFPDVKLANLYGATECSDDATHYVLAGSSESYARTIPVGTVLPNLQVQVVDRNLLPAPLGAAGELCIGGIGVGLGYLGDPRRTAAAFIPDPFAATAGARLYRTGDLAARRGDGQIEVFGRFDGQVKVRGFRIELGEIEAALVTHPAVREAVVMAPEEAPGARRLVALVVASGDGVEVGGLRAFLEARLPGYMVPAVFVELADLPRLLSGKVDRRALAEVALAARPAPVADTAAGAPRDATEELLAGIWREVLRLERVGIHDNFFELGGDSILILQVISRALRAGLRLSPRQIFESPSIAELAALAEPVGAEPASEPAAAAGPAALTPAQLWFLSQEVAHPEHFNQSLLFEVGEAPAGGRLQPALLRRAFAALYGHHDALRLRFLPPRGQGTAWRQRSDPPARLVPFHVVDVSALARPAAALAAGAAAVQGSFDLEQGPLFRAVLLRSGGPAPDRLLLAAHHLVVDGVSWRILLEDLETVCRHLSRGEEAPVLPRTTSFNRWAELLAEQARSPQMAAEAEVWRALLDRPVAALPLDADAGPNSVASAASVVVTLGEDETAALLREAPRAYRAQLLEVLLAALARAFAEWSGAPQLLVELEGHGREEIPGGGDLSRTVGFFTALFPVLLDGRLAGGPGTALGAAKEALRAVPRRGIGYGTLRYLESAAGPVPLAGLPLPEVVFNYLGQLDAATTERGIFRRSAGTVGATRHPAQLRPYLLEIGAAVSAGRLSASFVYSRNRHRRESVERLAAGFAAALRALVDQRRDLGTAAWTPSDFPLARLDAPALRQLLAAAGGPVEDIYPLSPVQEGMLFHSLHSPESGVYVEQLDLTLAEGVSAPAFERAWAQLVNRHAVLRTAFFWQDLARPLQAVRERATASWEHLDWSGEPAAERSRRLAAYLAADRRRGFDLGAAPLLRFALIDCGEEGQHFIWTFHHLLFDGWSLPILVRDLFAFYNAGEGGGPELAPPPRYRDYIGWLARQDLAAAEEFWRRNLRGFSTPTPFGLEAPDGGAPAAGNRSAGFPRPLAEATQRFARRHGLTVNTLLQGAWALLLHRYSGESDVVFGAVTAGRSAPLAGIEDIVGPFLNTVPVRVSLPPELELVPWLRHLQESQAEARQYEHAPLARVQAWSEVERGRPLFESILVFENYPVDESLRRRREGGLRIVATNFIEQTNYPLTVVVGPEPRLGLRIAFDGGRFEAAAVERLLHQVQALLGGMPETAFGPPQELPLLLPAERHQLLVEWNDTRTELPRAASLHALIEAQAARTPRATAVIFEEQRLSYAALDRWASGVARRLRGMGVGRGAVVGVALERSLELVPTLLGVLKAGAAYLPLDPEQPELRLAAMVADSGARVVVGRGPLPWAAVAVADWQAEGDAWRRGPARPGVTIDPLDLAYVIYTSGSTGVPKGVMNSHGGICNRLLWCQRQYGLTAADRILQKTPIGFDVSVWELFWPLIAGARMIVARPQGHRDPAYLLDLIEQRGVTTLHFVPSMLRALLAEAEEHGCPTLSRVIASGEALDVELERRFFARFGAELHNLYGPTEAAVDVTAWRCQPDPDRRRVPIGRPIANLKVHVVDRELRPVPAGVAGELCIGGAGLARGYLGQPEKTAASFVPDPFAELPGERLYRTGDLVRRLAGGAVEFLGRRDHQVKVRGLRIELGEIEAALAAHPAVAAAAVVVWGEREQQRLVAYFVARPGEVPGGEQLRAFLGLRLPEPMLPSLYLALPQMPLTASGKLDRRRLPEPHAGVSPQAARALPRTAPERMLAEVWAAVLGLAEVGIHDNFFTLGGDSILSLQVVSQARRRGWVLSPRQLFEAPTIARLAPLAVAMPRPAAHPEARPGQLPLTPIQSWFFEQGLAHPEHWNQALLLEVAPSALDRPGAAGPLPRLLAAALDAVAAHHDALRLRYRRRPATAAGDADWLQTQQGAEAGPGCAAIDLAALPSGARAAALGAAAARLQGAFDLERGPLLRAALFTAGAAEPPRLWLGAHHLVVDGVSWRILLEDLEAACLQLAAGRQPTLPSRTTSFRQWAEALARRAHAPAVRAQAGYWLERLGRDLPRLPLDHRDGAAAVGSTASVGVTLEAGATRALLQEASRAYRTQPQDALLASLALACAPWTGSRCLLLDLEGHGREEIEPELDLTRTVGWFTSLYPVLLELGGATAPGEVLKTIKEQLREVPGRGLPYGLLRYLGDGETVQRLRELPRAELLFNYLGQLDAPGKPEATGAAAPRLLRLARQSAGAMRHPEQALPHLLEVAAGVRRGRLSVTFTFSLDRHRRTTIERLARRFLAALEELIAHCLMPEAGGYTPSDFPLARPAAAALDRLAAAGAIEDLYPLSPLQEGLLFHSLEAPGSGVYVEQVSLRLGRGLQVEPFIAAWRRVVGRHAILRTAFAWQGLERPVQVVRPDPPLAWERHDWRRLTPAAQARALADHLAADRRSGFDLERAPLLRFALMDLGAAGHRFVWTFHHILLDGWSLPLLLEELHLLYEAEVSGQPAELPPALPFRDYVAWIAAQDAGAAEIQWRGLLAGFTAPTPLGVGREPAAAERAAGGPEEPPALRRHRLSPAESERLQGFARRSALTLSTLVQAAWAVVLGRAGGEDDVVFGMVSAGRSAPLPGIDRALGFFINTLPARVRMSPEVPVSAWLQQLQQRQAELRHHEFFPLQAVRAASEVPPGLPLFESIVAFENYPVDRSVQQRASGGLAVAEVELREQTHYPLTLTASPGPPLELKLLFDRGRFEAAEMARWLAATAVVLAGLEGGADAALDALPVLAPAERHQLLVEWNDTRRQGEDGGCLHEGFEAQARRIADAVALAAPDGCLTYGELNARANRLARRLRRHGVRPEAPVGLLLERSSQLVVAVLAVLKAGGAYVPLDPAYPRERLQLILADAGATLVLCDQASAAAAGALGAPALRVEAAAAAAAAEPREDLGPLAGPANLAYVIYTSGSTGRPKGVAVAHRSPVELVAWSRELFPPQDLAAVLAATSICFDLSVFELFVPLARGGRVLLAGNPLEMGAVEAAEATLVNTVPSAMAAVLAGGGRIPAAARTVNLAGEALPPELAAEIYRRPQVQRVLNLYGPSEDTVYSTWAAVERGSREVTIGRPVTGSRAYLLDRRLRPVPLGAAGELCLTGAGLARGYLGQPALTAERFLPDPFATAPGERLYRSGDLARWTAGGRLAFLGRLDQQVKVRGVRIELGEIEAALGSHPAVREAAALASGPAGHDRSIAAFVAPQLDDAASRDLRQRLRAWLPEAMLPSTLTALAALPRLPNGKLDRPALARLAAAGVTAAPAAGRDAAGPGALPRDQVEELLVEIFAQVLGGGSIGVDESFFERGGHSLLATRLVSRVQAAFGVELPLRAVLETPTVAMLAERLRQALATAAPQPPPAMAAVPRSQALRLSFAQQRLWFLDQLAPDGAVFNVSIAVRLRGRLRLPVLAAALGEIVARHEVLRSAIGVAEGQPVQLPAAPAPLSVPCIDVRGLPAGGAGGAAEARRRLDDLARRPFDLARPPLLRAVALRLAADEHLVLLVVHHIVFDGWSVGVLTRELGALYRAFSAGQPSPLPPLRLQYADFAAWQREWLQGGPLERLLEYWRRQLAGAPRELRLPTASPWRGQARARAGVVGLRVPAAVTARLRALTRRQGATLFMVLLAAFETLVGRYSGEQDLVVGTPIANRNRAETEDLIGFFVNLLVLRANLAQPRSFAGLVEQAREVTLAAYAHQDLPFDRLVEELQPERLASGKSWPQVVVALQNAPTGTLELPGLALSPVDHHVQNAESDMVLSVTETGGELRGVWGYNPELFDVAAIRRASGHLEALLAAAAAEPERPPADLPWLAAAERQALLVEWQDVPAPRRGPECLHELFAAQAARCPDAPAVAGDGEPVTYGELDRRAEGLAARLRGHGVGPEIAVGILAERSLAAVVSILGVLKAGGAFVPLDLSHPRERLRHLLADCRAPVLLACGRLAAELAPAVAGGGTVILGVDGAGHASTPAAAGAAPSAGAPLPVRGENLAYVIYTSGSTGLPKGVLCLHSAAVNLIQAAGGWFAVGPESRVLQTASLAFDASVLELFLTLGHGACLCLVPDELRQTPAALAHALVEQGVTTVVLTPGQLAVLPERTLASLRSVSVGGEACSGDLAARWARGRRLLNCYGPTETTIFATVGLCSADGPAAGPAPAPPSIGRPVENLEAYVLDPDLRPLPAGVVGELAIGGAGLARGYLAQPERTAERFVPHPFATAATARGARLYLTGDLARFGPAGELEFCGRRDGQVKLRGFRVELGEIEAALRALPEVEEAVVATRDQGASMHLVAYVVPAAGPRPSADRLRAALLASLPEYMVPAVWEWLPALPLTASGKLDRGALPAPGARRAAAASTQTPRTALERLLVGLWRDTLQIDEPGLDDNFFALGGHSILAAILVNGLQAELGEMVPVSVVFQHPTIAQLAAHLSARFPGAARRAAEGSAAPPDAAAGEAPPAASELRIERLPRPPGGRFPLSFSQERLWFLDRLSPGSAVYNMPLAARLRGPLAPAALAAALSAVERRHEVLRARFVEALGEPFQVFAGARPTPLPAADLRALPAARRERELRRLLEEEALRPFALAAGPPLRSTLVHLGDQEAAFLLTLHHIAADGWSVGLLARELSALYTAALERRPSPLPEPPVQYVDVALWQRRLLTGERLEQELEFWRGYLGERPPALDLPTDRPRPPLVSYAGAACGAQLDVELCGDLAALSTAMGATLFMTLLAAYEALLARHGGRQDFCIGTPVAGRHHQQTEGLIGCFLNNLVLRSALPGAESFADLVAGVRHSTLAAFAHQDLPFEKLVEGLALERDLSRAPVYQVDLTLQNLPPATVELRQLAVQPVAARFAPARLDLSLSALELGGRLELTLNYSVALFDHPTAQRLLRQLCALLAAAVAAPGRRASELPLLGAAERWQLLAEWNDSAAPLPEGLCTCQLIENQAARQGARVAVAAAEGELTYRKLESRANRLARHLRRRGVGAETRVGIAVERSLWLAVAPLAVWKAGGAYVPLDPAYPAERLALMIQDSGLQALLIAGAAAERLVGMAPGVAVVRLDDPAADWQRESAERLPPLASPDDLAYVIYTSGSTGRPKGVQVPHRALVNFLVSMQRRPGFTADDVLVAVTSLSFDIAGLEIFLPLIAGGRVVVADGAEVREGPPLARRLQQSGATVVQATPSTWRMLLEADWRPPTRLRALCGGESLPGALAEALRPRVRELWNLYGPTETTIWSTVADLSAATRITLGRPIANTEAFVTGPDGEPVPPGVAGEIEIGGLGVARGYLGRPDLTAERFRPDALSGRPGARLYRTGDLARALPDGRLDYLGRRDQQVKVRGVRIELEEIERAAAALPGVRQAVAVSRQHGGETSLVLFLVADEPPKAAAVRAKLRRRLPEPMIPSLVLHLPAVPLLPNGKVDRRHPALAAPAAPAAPHAAGVGPAGPRTALEADLLAIWEDLLGVRSIDVRDDFFEIGGHSLLAVRLLARIGRDLGRQVPLATLFAAPTVERLAERLEARDEAGAWSPLVLLWPQPGPSAPPLRGTRPPLFCVHPIGGGVTAYRRLAAGLAGDQPVYGLQAPAPGTPAPADAGGAPPPAAPSPALISEMGAAYVREVRKVWPQGPYLLAGWSFGGLVAFEMAHQLQQAGAPVALLALIDTAAPLGLARAPELDDAVIAAALAREEARQQGRSWGLDAAALAAVPAVERLGRVLAELHASGIVGPEIDLAAFGRWLAGYKQRATAQMLYQARPYDGRITLLRAAERDPGELDGTPAELRSRLAAEDLGWSAATGQAIEVRRVPGHHATMLAAASVHEVSKALAESIDAAVELAPVAGEGAPG